jgi:predicted nucleic acid-binding protein
MAKVMVSIPDTLLGALDAEAQRRGTSRSALLQAGARRELGLLRRERAAVLGELTELSRTWGAQATPRHSYGPSVYATSEPYEGEQRLPMSGASVSRAWIVDASVVLKWFLPEEREPDGTLARSAIGVLAMHTTSLAVYEVGNILSRHSGWPAQRIADALRLLLEICGDPVELTAEDHHMTARLAREHDLTFYDASYAAIAGRTGRGLLSAGRDLLAPGLAFALQDALA